MSANERNEPRIIPIEQPTDPTPTHVEWQLDGTFLVGVERPVRQDQRDRCAGKYLLDAGEWRQIRYYAIELPDDPELAMTLNFGDPALAGRIRQLEEEGIRNRATIEELERERA